MSGICEKHKLPITHLCLFIGCKKQRLICYKCKKSHEEHSQNISLLENLTEKAGIEFQDMNITNLNVSNINQNSICPNKYVNENNEQSSLYLHLTNLSLKSQPQNKFEDEVQNKNCFENNQSYNSGQAQSNLVQDFQYVDSNQVESDSFAQKQDSKDSVFTKILENDCYNRPCQLLLNSQKQSNQSTQASTIQNCVETSSKQNQFCQSIKKQGFQSQQFPFNSQLQSLQKIEDHDSQFNQNKKQIISNHENAFLCEIMKQDEDIQKACLFLRSMNDLKASLCAKIDRIKHSFLSSIQMKEEDFSDSFSVDSSTTNRAQIEERLKNNFEKFKLLSQFFDINQIVYSPQATSRSKLYQLEQEIDKTLSFNIQKIDSDQNQKKQKEYVDPTSKFAEFFQYYNKQPANIEALKNKINFLQPYQIEFDGVAKGNPGRSGAGFLIRDTTNNKIILEYSVDVDSKTINQAQYLALSYSMHLCCQLGIKQIRVQSDSEVIIKHMQGIYQVRSPQLKEYYTLAKSIDENFHSKEYIHVKKELNGDANAIAVSALI